jgi:hypothetical protein
MLVFTRIIQYFNAQFIAFSMVSFNCSIKLIKNTETQSDYSNKPICVVDITIEKMKIPITIH